jgi:hypothetical protein
MSPPKKSFLRRDLKNMSLAMMGDNPTAQRLVEVFEWRDYAVKNLREKTQLI